MPYVVRDQAGRIIQIHAQETSEALEEVTPDDPGLRAFLGETRVSADIQNALISSDFELVRVLEDLIAVLIDKRIIMLTDLPQSAQQKLARRYELRSKLANLDEILTEGEEIMLP